MLHYVSCLLSSILKNFIGSLISGLLKYTWFLLQFDALVAALPISVSGEEAQLKRISELQAENDAIGQELQKQLEAAEKELN